MRISLFILCSLFCQLAGAQQIKVQALKKQYNIDKETIYCTLRNLSADTVYYQVGLEIIQNGTVIRQVDDVFDLLCTKVEKVTKYGTLLPKISLKADKIDKESLCMMSDIVPLDKYDLRFRVVYNKEQVVYSTVFRLVVTRPYN